MLFHFDSADGQSINIQSTYQSLFFTSKLQQIGCSADLTTKPSAEVKRGRCSELSRVAYGAYLALGYDARMVAPRAPHTANRSRPREQT